MIGCHAWTAAGANPKWPSPFQVKCESLPFQPQIQGNPLDPSGIRIYAAYQIIWPGAACPTHSLDDPNVPQLNDYKSKYRPNILKTKELISFSKNCFHQVSGMY